MLNFQDLPDELVLNILSYSETIDLISCGQISKKIRRISHDSALWVTVNLEKKIVTTELLEMILGKGCRILNLCHCTILGHLSSNIESQLIALKWFQSLCECNVILCDCDEYIDVLEELLSSCCSLRHLVLKDVFLTPEMTDSICKNGKTLQTLNLNRSVLGSHFQVNLDGTPGPVYSYSKEIIKCCQEVKEVDLAYVNDLTGLEDTYLQFLAENISPNVEKLNLSSSLIEDNHVKILARRCNKIKALSLEPMLITDDSLTKIRQHLNLTLEELSLGSKEKRASTSHYLQASPMSIIFTGLLGLKSMQRFKILNLRYEKDDGEDIQNLRQQLPHLMIKGARVLN